jgi:adenylate kinase
MFRDHKKRGTDLGKKVAEILAAGTLVPDSVTNDMVRERLGRDDVKAGALLDGYPRNVEQAEELADILATHDRSISTVVVINVPKAELVQRILERGKSSGRKDDQDLEVVEDRQNTYEKQSVPCVAHFEAQGITVHRVDGVGSVDEVSGRILAALGIAP